MSDSSSPVHTISETLGKLGVPIPDVRSALTVLLAGLISIPFRYIHGYNNRLIADMLCGILLSFVASGYWGLISLSTVILTYGALCLNFKYQERKEQEFGVKTVQTPQKSQKRKGGKKVKIQSPSTSSPINSALSESQIKLESKKPDGSVKFSRVSVDVVLANFALLLVLQVFKRRKITDVLSPSLLYNWISQQMILFQKLVALALNSNESFRRWTNVESSPFDRNHKKMPPLQVLLGYAFTVNGSLAGGYVEYDAYESWLRETNKKILEKDDVFAIPFTKKKYNVSARTKANILYTLNYLQGCVWLIVYCVFGSKARELLIVGKPEKDLDNELMVRQGLHNKLQKWVLLIFKIDIGCFVFRTKYYFVWKIFRAITLGDYFAVSEKHDQSSGLYSVDYNTGKNIDIAGVELSGNSRNSMSSWNINTTKWFRKYIYLALTSQEGFFSKRSMATLVTNTSSALWHGISGGYYLFFVGFSLCVIVGRIEYNYVAPIFEELKETKGKLGDVLSSIYQFVTIVSSRVECDLFLPFFILLNGKSSLNYFLNINGAPVIWVVGRYIIFKTISKIPPVKRIALKRRAKKQVKRTENNAITK